MPFLDVSPPPGAIDGVHRAVCQTQRGLQMKKKVRLAAVLVVGGIIGYIVGPPAVQAATNLVTVKDPQTQAKARVTNGNLWTDSSGSVVYALTQPLFDVLL